MLSASTDISNIPGFAGAIIAFALWMIVVIYVLLTLLKYAKEDRIKQEDIDEKFRRIREKKRHEINDRYGKDDSYENYKQNMANDNLPIMSRSQFNASLKEEGK